MTSKDPIIDTVPMPIITPRFIIRSYRETDGIELTQAFIESINELRQWMPWAQEDAQRDAASSEGHFIAQAMEKWQRREELEMIIVDKNNDEKIWGAIGFRAIDWAVPKMEIGYWLRTSMTGKGLMTEAVNALTRYGFMQLNAQRIEILCDEQNIKSRGIPERLGFVQEGILRKNARTADGKELRNTVVYARYDSEQLPELDVEW